jgi:hypothetical protein
MIDQFKKLTEILRGFDESKDILDTNDVHKRFVELSKEVRESGSEPIKELFAESLASDFMECSSNWSAWGTFFGPIYIGPNEQGQQVEFPSIQHVTPEIIEYWGTRALSAEHPILKARYSDLVWDFSKSIIGEGANVTMAQLAIDSYLDIVKGKVFKHEVRAIDKLERALSVALSINDTERIESVRDAIIAFEDEIAEDDSPGLWGFSYDFLVDNKKVNLPENKIEIIVNNLEERFLRLCGTTEGSSLKVIKAERAFTRLIGYYRRLNCPDEVKRILKIYGDAFVKASELGSPLLAIMWIKNIYDLYMDNGMKEEADLLNPLMRKLGQKSKSEMKPVSAEIKIPTAKIDAYISAMTEGDLPEVLQRIVSHFLPDSKEVEDQVKDLAEKSPLQAMISESILDHDGRIVAQIGSVEDDLESRVVMQMAQNIKFENFFLRRVIEETISKFSPSTAELLDYLYLSPIFNSDKRGLFNIGLDAYLHGEHVVFAHVIIPLIESTLRDLLVLINRPTQRPGKRGGLFLRILDDILRDEGIKSVFGENTTNYLSVLLTDQRGLNLRNRICHGLMPSDGFGEQISDRFFHVLLLLAQVRKNQEETKE